MDAAALLVGINYANTSYALKGCINDVQNMRKLLVHRYNYREDCIKMLIEEAATRAEILKAFKNLISLSNEANGPKRLFFHYSGHGSSQQNTTDNNVQVDDGSESDGKDEVICPYDNFTIKDDEFRLLLYTLNADAKLFIVFDCCHSGTACDLPFNYRRNTLIKNRIHKPMTARIIMISGCQDSETSLDAVVNNIPQGALTSSLIECWSIQPRRTSWIMFYRALLSKMKQMRYKQNPCLSLGRWTDLNTTFEL